ncbi:hypothetical protein, partial [Streptomyces clavuligerus]
HRAGLRPAAAAPARGRGRSGVVTPEVGQVVRDAATSAVGRVMGHVGGRVQLRPLRGGREWDALPEDLTPVLPAPPVPPEWSAPVLPERSTPVPSERSAPVPSERSAPARETGDDAHGEPRRDAPDEPFGEPSGHPDTAERNTGPDPGPTGPASRAERDSDPAGPAAGGRPGGGLGELLRAAPVPSGALPPEPLPSGLLPSGLLNGLLPGRADTGPLTSVLAAVRAGRAAAGADDTADGALCPRRMWSRERADRLRRDILSAALARAGATARARADTAGEVPAEARIPATGSG